MMLLSFLKKDIRQFSRRKANILFMFLIPIVLIVLMSYSLDRYMEGNVGTFQDGRILYMVNTENQHMNQFTIFKEQISSDTGVQFEEIHSYGDGVERVNRQEAYAVISIHEQGYDYYRSPYNEDLGGKLIRTAFEQTIAFITTDTNTPVVTTTVLEGNTVNSFAYFTFSGLGLIMLYISSIIAHSVSNEKELRTLERIKLAKVDDRLMLVSKIVFGVLIGVMQIAEVYVFSSFILDVHWGSNKPLMISVLLSLAVFSSTLGAIVGIAIKNKLLINNLVLMLVVLIGFLGGAFSPISMLENIPVVSTIIRGSPLYWSNQALTYLYSGTIDSSVWIAMAVCFGSSLLLLALYRLKTVRQNSTSTKGVARHA